MSTRDVLSSTLELMKDRAVDNLYQRVTLFEKAKAYGGIEVHEGGSSLSLPIGTDEASVITEQVTGYEPVNLATAPQLDKANYQWAQFTLPLIISSKEQRENRGTEAKVKILEARMKMNMNQFQKAVSGRILNGGSPTANPATGLATLHAPADAPNAYLSIGTDVGGTVGGVARAGISGLRNQRQDLAADFDNVNDRMTAIAIRAAAEAPFGTKHCWITNEEFFRGYKDQLFDRERYIDVKQLDGGRLELAFQGAPVIYDPQMAEYANPSADDILAYCVNFENIKFHMLKGGNFDLEDIGAVSGASVYEWHLVWHGQFAADQLASSGVITRGTT